MAFQELYLYITSVSAANRRDLPYYSNDTGTVISDLAWATDNNRKGWGRDSSDNSVYTLEVLNATTIRVYSADEYGDDATDDVSVTAGGTYETLVPGVSIDLNATLTTGHIATVRPSILMLADSSFYIPRGEAGDNIELKLYNGGTITHKAARLDCGRGWWYSNDTNTPIASISADSLIPIADEYALEVTAGTSSGLKYTWTGALNTYEADNVAVGSTNNPLDDSANTGLYFDCDLTAADGDAGTLVISDGADALQLAPDDGGAPGTWVDWSDTTGLTVPLNRAGYSDQQIPASQTITVWLRANPDASHPIGRANARLIPVSYQAES